MVDWTLILARLRKSRGSIAKVAPLVNACPDALNKIARGEVTEPKFMVGVKLLDLHFDDYPDIRMGLTYAN